MKQENEQQAAVNLNVAFFGAARVDRLIREIKSPTGAILQYECAVCTRLDMVYAPDDEYHVRKVRAGLREHVLQDHRTEFELEVERQRTEIEEKEARGEAFVTREGDFEKYAAMPQVDETYGEFFADAGLTPTGTLPHKAHESPTITYKCDGEGCQWHGTLDDGRLHVEKEHPQVVFDEATRRASERDLIEYGKQSSDLEFISVEGNGVFGCRVCQTDPTHRQDMTHDSVYGTLTDMRAHLLKAHSEKLAEFIAREVQEKDAEKTADADTHLAPSDFASLDKQPHEPRRKMYEVGVEGDRFNVHDENDDCARAGCEPVSNVKRVGRVAAAPLVNSGEPHGSRTEDSHLVKRGISLSPSSNGVELFDCTLCDDENAFLFPLDLGRKHVAEVHLSKAFGRDWRDRWLEWHFVTGSRGDLLFICRLCDFSTEQLEGRTMTDAREHVKLKHAPDESHVPAGMSLGSVEFGRLVLDRMHVAPVGNIAGLYQCRRCAPPHEWLGSLDRVRQHVEREHDAGLKAAHIENAQAGRIVEPCGFEFKAEQPCSPPIPTGQEVRRAGELLIVLDQCVARVKHEKCGELFETTDEAMSHTCVAETLPAGDDVLLLKGQLASDAAARRRERASHRNTVLEAGTLATKIREATDDLFLLLARATEVVDFDERQQLSDEKERSKR